MKILVIGDIHGNLISLEKVLIKEKNNYDLLVCHGDIVNYGPWSNECFQLLKDQKSKILLKGNHEDYFLNKSYTGKHPIATIFFNFCMPKFNYNNCLTELTDSFTINNYIFKHTILDKYIFKDTHLNDNEIEANYIIGHSHQQFFRKINKHEIINTGSLGQNREFINKADYLIFDTKKNYIDFKYLIFNVDILINEMKVMKYNQLCIDYYLQKKRI